MQIPDVMGFTLGEARGIMDAAGTTISSIIVTAPPKDICKDYDDSFRIVRLKAIGEKTVELLVCKPDIV